MRILYKTPFDKSFRELVIPNTLKLMQDLVDGTIQAVPLSEEACVICNEEGRLVDLPHNCVYEGVDYVGNILVVGVDGEEFTDCPLSLVQANEGIGEGA